MPGAAPTTVLCLHEGAATGAIWNALAESLAGHATLVAPDRPGWGTNEAPEGYARTTIAEQAGFAASALGGRGPAVVVGAGIGAVAALELSLAEPGLVSATVLIEPPLLSFVPEATDRLAADVGTLRDSVQTGGKTAALDTYLSGRLPALGPGAERLPDDVADRRPEAATTLFAELSAVPAWERTDTELASVTTPSLIVVAADSPPFLRKAATALAKVLGRAELRETEPGLPHVANAGELAALVVEVADSVI